MSSPLATVPLDTLPQNPDNVTSESEKKYNATSSISSLLNSTKPADDTHGRNTGTPSSPELTVTSPPPGSCGAPEQQQQQRKRSFSVLDKGGELSITTTDDTRSLSLSQYSLDTPQQQQQQTPSGWQSGSHHQHYHHHLPTPVSPAAPMSQNNPQSAEVGSTEPMKKEPNETNDRHHHHRQTPSQSKPEISTGMYTSFSVKQSSTSHTHSNNSSNNSSATTLAGTSSPLTPSPLKTRSPRESTPTTPKPYTCTECDQTFSRAHNLKSHTATHSMERPYKCESCQAKFRRLHDLKRHQKLHTGERPYICDMCQRSFSRLDALNRHQRTEGGSACHYRQNRRRTDQKHSDSFDEEASSPPPPSPMAALGPGDRHPAATGTGTGAATATATATAAGAGVGVGSSDTTASPQLLSTPSASSPTLARAPGGSSFSPSSLVPAAAPLAIQQQQMQQNQMQQTQTQMQPQRPAPSRPSIPQLNLRHRFTSPYHAEDAKTPQPLVFRSTPTSTTSMVEKSPHEATRRIVLPPPSNCTSGSNTPAQSTSLPLNTFSLHPPPPPTQQASAPPQPRAATSPSRPTYPLPSLPSSHQGIQLDRVKRRRRRSSGGESENATTDTIVSPSAFNGPESYNALHLAYVQLLEEYRGLQTTINHASDAKVTEVETLRRKVHDLQVENRVLRSLVFERQQ